MNLRKKFLAACVMGTAIVGFSVSAEAQITTTTNRLKLVNGANSLTLMPPTSGGNQTLTFPDMSGGGTFVMTTSVNGQTITSTGPATTALTISGNQAITGNQTVGGTQTITGAFTGNGGATITGAASITGGLDNNTGGITEAGAISGATTLANTTNNPLFGSTGAGPNSLVWEGTGVGYAAIVSNTSNTAVSNGLGVNINTNDAGTIALEVQTFGHAGALRVTGDATVSGSNWSFSPTGALDAGSLTLDNELAVAEGGTGATTLTQDGVLLGNGTNDVTATTNTTLNSTRFLAQTNTAGTVSTPVWSDGSGNFIINGTTTQASSNFNISGNGTVGTNLAVGGTATVTGATTLNGALDVNSTSNFDGAVTVTTGGANITGGVDNNSGGITEAGAVSGVTTVDFGTSRSISQSGGFDIMHTAPGGHYFTVDNDASGGGADEFRVYYQNTGNLMFSIAPLTGLIKSNSLTTGGLLSSNGSGVILNTNLSGDITTSGSMVTAIAPGVIVNADVNAAAAIDGTKISPNFGTQAVTTSGNISTTGTGSITSNTMVNAVTGYQVNGTAATGTILRGNGTNYVASTATYPNTTTANQLLVSTAANTVGELTTANNGVLVTSGAGVPSVGSTLPNAVQDNITRTGTVVSGTWQGTAVADTYVANDLTIVGGTINNTPIGATTASTGKFTTLETTGLATLGASATVTGTTTTDMLAGTFSGRTTLNPADGTTHTITNAACKTTSTVTVTYRDPSTATGYDVYMVNVKTINNGNFVIELPMAPDADHEIIYTIIN
jgi:hypothetical protein